MTVGALCDLGVKPSIFEWELSKIDLGDFHMHFERQTRQHIAGVKFGIHGGATHEEKAQGEGRKANEHHHEHSHEEEPEHHHHEHMHTRSYREIRALLEASDLSSFVKQHALSMFQ